MLSAEDAKRELMFAIERKITSWILDELDAAVMRSIGRLDHEIWYTWTNDRIDALDAYELADNIKNYLRLKGFIVDKSIASCIGVGKYRFNVEFKLLPGEPE